MPSLIKQLYKNFESKYKINRIINFGIFLNIAFIIVSMSNLYIILYKSVAKIMHIIYLHLIKDLYIILTLLIILAKQIIQLICNSRPLLLAYNKLIFYYYNFLYNKTLLFYKNLII